MTATTAPQQTYMQGIAVPATSVRPAEFFARTRRKRQVEQSARTWAGFGGTDVIELKKSDIIAGAYIRLKANITTVKGTGLVKTTGRWPYDILGRCKFTANGQSNIINVSGAKLKVRELMSRGDLSDRGVSNTVNTTAYTQGTLAQASEAWGIPTQCADVADGTYDVDLVFFLPIAEDQVDLSGAIFAATSSTDLTISLEWATRDTLFTLSSNAAVTVNSATVTVESIKYAIPKGGDGEIVVPDLSLFHSLIEGSYTALQTGVNEPRLTGQGAGKQLLRLFFQVWNGATSAHAPLVMNDTNFGRQGWRYSGNETPDEIYSGGLLRAINEREYGSDIGRVHGFGCHEFAEENAFRDAVDMGQTSDLRLYTEISAALTGSPRLEYVMETVYQAGAGA